jgi:hypothetical protein
LTAYWASASQAALGTEGFVACVFGIGPAKRGVPTYGWD